MRDLTELSILLHQTNCQEILRWTIQFGKATGLLLLEGADIIEVSNATGGYFDYNVEWEEIVYLIIMRT